MHEVLVNCLGLSLFRKSVVRLTVRPNMTLTVYCGRKTTQTHHARKSALAVASALANVKVFYVMGKALSGELSCPCDRSCYLLSYII